MNRYKQSTIAWVAGGVLLGMLCAVITVGLLWMGKKLMDYETSAGKDTAPTAVPSPTVNAPALLDEARDAINAGHPDWVKRILFPVVPSFASDEHKAAAYRMMGEAEELQDHYQLAAGYYAKLFATEPTAQNLLLLAETYDNGGDSEQALAAYKQFVKKTDPEVDLYRADIEMRIQHLTEVLETRYQATLTPEAP